MKGALICGLAKLKLAGLQFRVSSTWTLETKGTEQMSSRQQAQSNSKQQFRISHDLKTQLVIAMIIALHFHSEMSTHAFGSYDAQKGLVDLLLRPARRAGSVFERV